ncbi:MAG: enoyl-CoA hydratase-related protein [Myxococcota bacterium]|nr:enoyl-CoA hydratase-related protein [Myxococcota bacterium]
MSRMPESTYREIVVETANGVATITLNRPDKLNAYLPSMGDEIVHAFRHAVKDDHVRALILTGAGRGFCAGVDLEALQSANESAAGPRLGEEDFVRKLPLEIWNSPKPVIAAINGAAIGVGATMTLACDIRLVAEDAKIGFTFAKLGILPGLGSTHLLPRLVGMGKALELVLGAEIILGEEAARIGLAQYSLPAEGLMDRAREIAEGMAALDPAVLAGARQGLREGPGLSLAEAMKHEQSLSANLRKSREGGA